MPKSEFFIFPLKFILLSAFPFLILFPSIYSVLKLQNLPTFPNLTVNNPPTKSSSSKDTPGVTTPPLFHTTTNSFPHHLTYTIHEDMSSWPSSLSFSCLEQTLPQQLPEFCWISLLKMSLYCDLKWHISEFLLLSLLYFSVLRAILCLSSARNDKVSSAACPRGNKESVLYLSDSN